MALWTSNFYWITFIVSYKYSLNVILTSFEETVRIPELGLGWEEWGFYTKSMEVQNTQ